jgi:hypothetical protein
MKTTSWLTVVAFMMATGVAFAGVTVDIAYDFEPGAQTASRVQASIDDVQMGRDVPLAVTGEAAVDLTLEVISVEEDTATLRGSFGEVEASLLDEAQEPTTPSPVELRVDDRGALAEVDTGDDPELDLFASGGVPLQLVVLLAGVVEMPDGPIGVGETWSAERCQQLPQVGEIALRVESRIVRISAAEVTVITDLQATLPDFTTANPMQEGEITISDGVLTIDEMTRTIDVETGLIKSVEAEMVFDGRAAFGPIAPLPLSVTSSFTITPSGATPQETAAAGEQQDG